MKHFRRSMPQNLTQLARVSEFLGALVVVIFASCVASGVEPTWESSPYRTKVWLASKTGNGECESVLAGLEPTLLREIELHFGSSIEPSFFCGPTPAPIEAIFDSTYAMEAWDEAIRGEDRTFDKIFFVGATLSGGSIDIMVRECDMPTRTWGKISTSQSAVEDASASIAQQMATLFSPCAKVERVEGRKVIARLRASELAVGENCPARMTKEQFLTPVIRTEGKKGSLPESRRPPWTFLKINSIEAGRMECEMFTGIRNAIPAKGGSRIQRFLLGVHPTESKLTLKVRARAKDKHPLAGYEIYLKAPEAKDSTMIGRTNWKGEIEIAPAPGQLKILYVKNGGQLLARLPFVTGYSSYMEAAAPDDDKRLEAEGAVRAMQARVMDLVARRELLARRIRLRLTKNDKAGAAALYEGIHVLDSKEGLLRELETQKQRIVSNVSAEDRVTSERITKLFTDASTLVTKYVTMETSDSLAEEIRTGIPKPPKPIEEDAPQPAP